MRVSTAQFYFQNTQNMTQKNAELNEQSVQITSGKRVLTAKDDSVLYSSLAGYKDDLSKIEQYTRNITQSKSHNELTETSLSQVQSSLLKVKQLFIQGNSGSLSVDDRQSVAEQLKQSLSQILDIANSKDERGAYIFSGHQIDTKPFVQQSDNSVTYQGDNGVNQLAIGENILIDTNLSGDQVFQKINNDTGDFSPSYTINDGGVRVSSASVINRGAYDTATFPPGYTLDFTDADTNGELEVVITDSNSGAVTTIDPLVPGQSFTFNGVEVALDGTPFIGDQITLDENEEVSIFETMKSAIDWLEVKGDPAMTEQHQIDYSHILGQLNTAMNYLSAQQGSAGINLQLIESQESRHLDSGVALEKNRSSIEDLDFYQAATRLEQSEVALQAAQLTFSKVQGLSLLNYL